MSEDNASITRLSAGRLAELIRARQVSSREVVDAHLARIEQVNPQINAVVQLDAEGARAAAARADAAIARGDDAGALHGVPFTVKDWIETEGLICAAGVEERRTYVPKRDATAVARMRAAGAILLGKTNVTDGRPVYARPNNPYDLERTPGASSSGEAAIIAAGGSPLGIGSDSGGSIRFPAHCCGVAGLRPSNGRVPLTGHFPRIGALSDPRTAIGPVARTVDDLALALGVIAGPDGFDPSALPLPPGEAGGVELRGLRVAVFTEMAGVTPTAEIREATERAARSLAPAVAVVEQARPDCVDEARDITERQWRRHSSAGWSAYVVPRPSELTADEIERLIFDWERFQRSMLAFMRDYDAIVCPACPWPAPPHGRMTTDDYAYTLPSSLTGWPAVVVRAGTSPEGLPLGVQVIAGALRDDVALAVAGAIERACGGWEAPAL